MPKISTLPAIETPAIPDVFPIDDVDSSNLTKKMTLGQMAEFASTNITPNIITKDEINWTTGGIWWEEIGRTTLSSVGDTILVSGLPAYKYIQVLFRLYNSGAISANLIFNNDVAINYSRRMSINGASDTSSTLSIGLSSGSSTSTPQYGKYFIYNIATSEKMVEMTTYAPGIVGAANAPIRSEGSGKWANTTDAISSIEIRNLGAGDYTAGSEVVVLGHN